MSEQIELPMTRAEALVVMPALRSQRGCNEVFKANMHPGHDMYDTMEQADEVLVGVIQRIKLLLNE